MTVYHFLLLIQFTMSLLGDNCRKVSNYAKLPKYKAKLKQYRTAGEYKILMSVAYVPILVTTKCIVYILLSVVKTFESMIFNKSFDSMIINQLFIFFFFVATQCRIERTTNHFKI